MINIIVASHGPMAKAMLDSARMVYGDLPYCYAVTLTGEAGIEGFKQDFARVLAQASQHAEGVLVLCDMQSGTPWNVASSAAFRQTPRRQWRCWAGLICRCCCKPMRSTRLPT